MSLPEPIRGNNNNSDYDLSTHEAIPGASYGTPHHSHDIASDFWYLYDKNYEKPN